MNITLQEIKNLLAESNQDRFPNTGEYAVDQEGPWYIKGLGIRHASIEKNRMISQGKSASKKLKKKLSPDFVQALTRPANLREEIANSTGGDVGAGEKGPIASIGVGVDGDPGLSKKRRQKFRQGRCKGEASQLGRKVGIFLRRSSP